MYYLPSELLYTIFSLVSFDNCRIKYTKKLLKYRLICKYFNNIIKILIVDFGVSFISVPSIGKNLFFDPNRIICLYYGNKKSPPINFKPYQNLIIYNTLPNYALDNPFNKLDIRFMIKSNMLEKINAQIIEANIIFLYNTQYKLHPRTEILVVHYINFNSSTFIISNLIKINLKKLIILTPLTIRSLQTLCSWLQDENNRKNIEGLEIILYKPKENIKEWFEECEILESYIANNKIQIKFVNDSLYIRDGFVYRARNERVIEMRNTLKKYYDEATYDKKILFNRNIDDSPLVVRNIHEFAIAGLCELCEYPSKRQRNN